MVVVCSVLLVGVFVVKWVFLLMRLCFLEECWGLLVHDGVVWRVLVVENDCFGWRMMVFVGV